MTRSVQLDVTAAGADGAAARARGLLGRDGIDVGTALWIAPCRQVHTFAMRFPIDVAFVDADRVARHVVHDLRPWRMSRWVRGAVGALETQAGVLAAHGVAVGDRLAWEGAGP